MFRLRVFKWILLLICFSFLSVWTATLPPTTTTATTSVSSAIDLLNASNLTIKQKCGHRNVNGVSKERHIIHANNDAQFGN